MSQQHSKTSQAEAAQNIPGQVWEHETAKKVTACIQAHCDTSKDPWQRYSVRDTIIRICIPVLSLNGCLILDPIMVSIFISVIQACLPRIMRSEWATFCKMFSTILDILLFWKREKNCIQKAVIDPSTQGKAVERDLIHLGRLVHT